MRGTRTAIVCGLLLALGAVWATCSGQHQPAPTALSSSTSSSAPDTGAGPVGRAAAAVLADVTISGRVRARRGGHPLPGAVVLLGGSEDEARRAVADDAGRFRLRAAFAAGSHRLRASAEGFLDAESEFVVPLSGERDAEEGAAAACDVGDVWLESRSGVRVLVRSFDAAPLEGVRVEALPAWFGLPPGRATVRPWAETLDLGARPAPVETRATGPDGLAWFHALIPGGTVFIASHPDHARAVSPTVLLGPGEHPHLIEMALQPAHTIHGRVVDAAGEAVPDARVTAGEGLAVWATRTRTDRAGCFELGGLPRGAVYLRASSQTGLRGATTSCRVPSEAEIVLRLRRTGTLSGRVVDRGTGASVGGVELRLHVPPGGTLAAVSADDGSFAIPGVPKGMANLLTATKDGLILAAEQPGYVLTGGNMGPSLQVGEIDSESHVVRTVYVQRAARLSGVVRGPDGPLAGAHVTVKTQGRGTLSWGVACDDAGRFEFPSMVPGRVVLFAAAHGHYAPDHPRERWPSALRSSDPNPKWVVDVPASGDVVRDVKLARGVALSGRVVATTGEPVGGARVAASRSVSDPVVVEGFTGDDGTFRLAGVPPVDGVRVYARADSFQPGSSEALAFGAGEPPTDVQVVLQPDPLHEVSGRVVSLDGLPVAGGYVQISSYGGGYPAVGLAEWSRAERFPVAQDGTYTAALRQGSFSRFRVRAIVPGHAEGRSAWIGRVPGGDDRFAVDVRVAVGATLSGGVRDADTGEPIAGATLWFSTPLDHEPLYFWYSVEGATDRFGRFRVPHLPDGPILITALAAGYAEETERFVVPGDLDGEFALHRAQRLTGSVRWANGTPVVDAVLRLLPGGDAPVPGLGRVEARTAHDGGFRFSDLRPGVYQLDVRPFRDDQQQFGPFRAGPFRTRQAGVEIIVEPQAHVAGTVVDAAGAAVEGVTVEVRTDAGVRSAATSPSGDFEVAGLDAGPCDVVANPDGAGGGRDHGEARVPGVVAPADGVRLALPAGYSISGVVRDAAGQGIAGLWVAVGSRRVATDGSGRFVLRGLTQGEHDLLVVDPPLGPRRHRYTSLDGGDDVRAGSSDVVLTAR